MTGGAATHYREYAPCDALREHVRAMFVFAPASEERAAGRRLLWEARFGAGDPFCSPTFADGHASIVFRLGMVCEADGSWRANAAGPAGTLIGPMTRVDAACAGRLPALAGVYLRAGKAGAIAGAAAAELTDRVVGLEELWGREADEVAGELDAMDEAGRLSRLEAALLRRVAAARCGSAVDVAGLAAWIRRAGGRVTVAELARAAGVSRQHLTVAFRAAVGVTPKVYCRLARFQSALSYTGRDWAGAAVEAGYADQSHMIAEFREFSSLTPQRLAAERWFHPFIERARRSGSPGRDPVETSTFSTKL